MRIKATQMERIFGMSQNGIRLYEKHGILRLERRAGSSYRLYGPEEMLAMGCGVQLRRYGFSMQETGELLDTDEDGQLHALEAREEAIAGEIERLLRVRKSLRTQTARIRQAERLLDACVLEEKPAMYFLGTLRDGRPTDEGMIDMLSQWVDAYTPHLSAAMLLDGPYLTRTDYHEPPLQGVAVDADVALELGLRAGSQMLYLPPKPCVVTAVRYAVGDSLEPVFERVRRYARENGHRLHAGAVIRQVQCVRRGERNVQTGLLYAPLDGDERQFGATR
ncbi:MAG: MerR family transcriptional regulator [Clostridia bacterium]|nr:MerR family transcriptional regulator [Clostridia bacterium]